MATKSKGAKAPGTAVDPETLLARAPSHRWQRGCEPEEVTLDRDSKRRTQRVHDAVRSLERSGRISGAHCLEESTKGLFAFNARVHPEMLPTNGPCDLSEFCSKQDNLSVQGSRDREGLFGANGGVSPTVQTEVEQGAPCQGEKTEK